MENQGSNLNDISKESQGNYGVWWHSENLGPLINLPHIVQFGSMKFSKVRIDDTMLPHLNDGIEIHFVNSGRYKWVVDNKEVELFPDSLSVTAPWQLNGSPTGIMNIGNISWIVIKPFSFTPNKALNLGKWSSLSKSFQEKIGNLLKNENVIVVKKAKLFKQYFLDLRYELQNQDEGCETKVNNLIENLFIDLFRELSIQKQKIKEEGQFVDQLKKIIREDFNKKWIIDDLAAIFGMGKTKFTYEVRKLTGYPPNSFIINLKIEKAIELITKNNGMKMSDIAFSCGFSSLQHFSSIFLQRVGVSPGKFKG